MFDGGIGSLSFCNNNNNNKQARESPSFIIFLNDNELKFPSKKNLSCLTWARCWNRKQRWGNRKTMDFLIMHKPWKIPSIYYQMLYTECAMLTWQNTCQVQTLVDSDTLGVMVDNGLHYQCVRNSSVVLPRNNHVMSLLFDIILLKGRKNERNKKQYRVLLCTRFDCIYFYL